MNKPLLEVEKLSMSFPVKGGFFGRKLGAIHAVDQVSFEISKGETLGLVGESGCGKSTLGRCLMRLYRPTSGKVLFDGVDIRSMPAKDFFPWRKRMQIIFQDPFASLNPRMTVEQILSEPLNIHKLFATQAQKKSRVMELLDLVGLRKDLLYRYPHEFSGGQRQRIAIARSLAVEPEFIVCDEPVSALDVSIQAQIVNLLQDLQQKLGLTYLFVAHDLKVVKHISNRIAVMYLGRIVELADSEALFSNPKHPYTQALLSAIPVVNRNKDLGSKQKKSNRIILKGDVGSALNVPSGCAFHPRCPKAESICAKELPETRFVGGSKVACHFAET
jgi:oligopeptide/dipeptide ABC transporter ATP-binding protein